jgi:hypothetical protein
MDIAVGQLSALTANIHSKNGNFTLRDFALYLDEPELTLEQAMKEWA